MMTAVDPRRPPSPSRDTLTALRSSQKRPQKVSTTTEKARPHSSRGYNRPMNEKHHLEEQGQLRRIHSYDPSGSPLSADTSSSGWYASLSSPTSPSREATFSPVESGKSSTLPPSSASPSRWDDDNLIDDIDQLYQQYNSRQRLSTVHSLTSEAGPPPPLPQHADSGYFEPFPLVATENLAIHDRDYHAITPHGLYLARMTTPPLAPVSPTQETTGTTALPTMPSLNNFSLITDSFDRATADVAAAALATEQTPLVAGQKEEKTRRRRANSLTQFFRKPSLKLFGKAKKDRNAISAPTSTAQLFAEDDTRVTSRPVTAPHRFLRRRSTKRSLPSEASTPLLSPTSDAPSSFNLSAFDSLPRPSSVFSSESAASSSVAQPSIGSARRSLRAFPSSILHTIIEQAAAATKERTEFQSDPTNVTSRASGVGTRPAGPPLALTSTMMVNLLKFVGRIGPVFRLQGKIERLFYWESTMESLLFLCMYMLLCLHPQMFYAAPFVLPPTLLVYNHYLAYLEAGKKGNKRRPRERQSAQAAGSSTAGVARSATLSQKLGKGWFSRKTSEEEAPRREKKRAHSSESTRTVPRRPFYRRNKSYHEYRKNLQGIQNMMGQYCQAHDAFIQWLKDVSGREMSVLLHIWAIAAGLLTVFYLIPLRFIFLVGGTTVFVRGSVIGDIAARTTHGLIQRLRFQ